MHRHLSLFFSILWAAMTTWNINLFLDDIYSHQQVSAVTVATIIFSTAMLFSWAWRLVNKEDD